MIPTGDSAQKWGAINYTKPRIVFYLEYLHQGSVGDYLLGIPSILLLIQRCASIKSILTRVRRAGVTQNETGALEMRAERSARDGA